MLFDLRRILSNMKADQATFKCVPKKNRSAVGANDLFLRALDLTIRIINGKTFKILIGSSLIHLIGPLLAIQIALLKSTFQINKRIIASKRIMYINSIPNSLRI